jgi:sialate O-acetylesterase
MFGDNMVLQREKPVSVWGTGDPGLELKVRIGEEENLTTVGGDGEWNATLNPMTAGGPYTLTVQSEEETIEFENVMIGEVWLCSGQSNMQFTTSAVADADSEIQKAADYPEIRLFLVQKFGADAPKENPNGKWEVCSPDTIGDFSAVAYFFARDLKISPALKDIPIGLIDSSYGGTMVEAWMSTETLSSRFPDEDLRNSFFGWKPTTMYNGMIAPLIPFQLRGFLWYQGESNCGRPEQYGRLFPGMINNWREAWGQPELPFIFVQLPNYADSFDNSYFTWIREIQHEVAKEVPGTGMAVTIDTADGYDVHPKTKRAVGLRLSLIARNTVYGEDIACSGPVYKSHEIAGSKVRVKFDHADKGLANDNRGPLRGFATAGSDKQFWYADAEIEKDTVILTSPHVPKPQYVRYAWEADPHADLYNTDGLPAAPFRTDTFPRDDFEIYLVPNPRKIITSHYEALVDGYSWLQSLKSGGNEFLEPMNVSGMPGAFYFTFWGPSRLVHMKQLGPAKLFAEMDASKILYEFFDNHITITLNNDTTQDVSYLFILSNDIKAAKGDDEIIRAMPLKGEHKATTWYCGDRALEIIGEGKLKYPLNSQINNQSWETRLKAHEKQEIQLRLRKIESDELSKIDSILKKQTP